jgi:hypothetical protein
MLFAVSLSSAALAQPGDAADTKTADTKTADTKTADTKTADTKSDETKSSSAAVEDNASSSNATDAKATDTKAASSEKADSAAEGSAKLEAAVPPRAATEPAAATSGPPPVAVEILPGAAYPEPRTRGLVGGSLWLTMHGYQFPYMPRRPGEAAVRLAISGSVWSDTSYARIYTGLTGDPSLKRWTNQTRGVLRFTPTYSTEEGWFAQGQVELVAKGNQVLSNTDKNLGGVDDVFVRVGKWGLFDVTVGRFQGWEVYHYGMGLDLNTLERDGAKGLQTKPNAPAIYGLSTYWDRPDGGAGNYAGHLYVTDYLRFELLGQLGTTGSVNTRAVRPVGILDLGYVKVKLGTEYGVNTDQQVRYEKYRETTKGYGGAVQFVLNPWIEGGINGAVAYVDTYNTEGNPDYDNSTTQKSFGGFLNGRIYGPLLVGGGVNQTTLETLKLNQVADSPNYGKANLETHLQTFFAIQYSLWDKVFFKFVGAYARYKFEDNIQNPPVPFQNSMWSGRLRVMYLF